MIENNLILIAGYAKLPNSVTAGTVYSTLAVAVVFDKRTGIIVEAEASMVTDLAKRFVSELLIGYDLGEGPEPLINSFEEQYHGNVKKALESAIMMLFTRYQEFLDSPAA